MVTPVAVGEVIGVDLRGDDDAEPARPGNGAGGSSTGSSRPSGCVTEPAMQPSDGTTITGNGASEVRITRAHPVFGHLQGGTYRLCNGSVAAFWWNDLTQPTAEALYSIPLETVRRQVPPPTPDLSPTSRGVVNLGMWLAAVRQPDVTARIDEGNLFGRVTATHSSTTFDPGNGDEPITCEGAGTPITDLDTIDEGPCGYTYRASSPVGDPFTLNVAITWSIRYETSSGNGTLPPLTTSIATGYEVVEIQTIGVAG
jgi:hypothetical protein